MADKLMKYGVQFTKGESVDVVNPDKFLAVPYFSEVKATRKKRVVKK